jgi:galactokinase
MPADTPRQPIADGPGHVRAHAPGRVCVLGEHTDYNEGLALSFAIAQGVTVRARRIAPAARAGEPVRGEERVRGEEVMLATALDLGEQDEFPLAHPGKPGQATGWRAFVRGMVAELTRAGLPPVNSSVQIQGDLPRGGGLASSAALEVALALALLALAGRDGQIGRTELGELCSRVENQWFGAHTGLLDQLSSLYGEPDMGLRIDFRTLSVTPVALTLDGWRFVTLDSGEQRTNASSGYNRRRAECARACELLGVRSLRALGERPREERERLLAELPPGLCRRARHVLSEDDRVDRAIAALAARDLPALGRLLNEAHDSLRDDMEISTPALDATVARMREAGAAGARLLGGGFGGSVLALLPPDVPTPAGAREAQPCAGARVIEERA